MKRLVFFILSIVVILSFLFYQNIKAKTIQGGGEQLTYSFESEGMGFSDIQGLYNTDSNALKTPFFQRSRLQKLVINLHCVVKTTKIRENTEGGLFCYEIKSPDFSIENTGFPVQTEALKNEITHPFFAETTPTGQIKNVRIDTAISFTAADVLKNMLSQMQFIKPLTDSSSWITEEENASGTFKAQYHFDKKEGSLTWFKKSNGGYTKLKSSNKGEHILADNQTHILVDSAFRIAHLDLSESQMVLYNTDTISASGNQVQMHRTNVSVASSEELQKWAALYESSHYSEAMSLSAPISTDRMNRMVYKNALGNDNFETLMAKLNPLKNKVDDHNDSLVMKFRALAYLFPAECEKMGSILKKASPESPVFAIISNALASTETTQSINTLSDVIEVRANEEEVIAELLPILATTPFPTEKAVNIVKKLAFSHQNPMIASTAQLTLGGLAGNYRKTDPKQQAALTDFILSKMQGTTDTLQLILVLGNTGSPKILPQLKGYMNANVSPQIRAAAVNSVRFITEKDIQNLLETLAMDKDSILSKAAIETIEFRKEQ